MRARARSVDLVGKKDVGEDWALPEDELPRSLVEDRDAEHVAREQIARELHAAKLAADSPREGARERGLANTGDVLDEQMTAREQRHERKLHGFVLSLERTLDRHTQSLD